MGDEDELVELLRQLDLRQSAVSIPGTQIRISVPEHMRQAAAYDIALNSDDPLSVAQVFAEETENKEMEQVVADKTVKTMRDARAKHYEIFTGSDEACGKREAILKYIETLGLQTGTDVSSWRITSFMDRGFLITNRPEINKIFFKLKNQNNRVKPEKPSRLVGEELAQANQLINIDHMAPVRRLAKEIRSNQATIRAYKKEILRYEGTIAEQKIRAKGLREFAKNASVIDYRKDIQRVLREGKFFVHDLKNPFGIIFRTAPITKTYFNTAQATATMVPLGTFLVKIVFTLDNKWTANVTPHENNIRVGRYTHPHVMDGAICWGTVTPARQKAQDTYNFYDYMKCVWEALAEFQEGGSPYVELHRFEEQLKADKQKQKENIRGPYTTLSTWS